MPLSNPTATTGVTTPNDKYLIPYGVWNDVAVSADTATRGHTVTLVVDANNEQFFLYDLIGYSEVVGSTLHRVLPERSGYDGTMYAAGYRQAFRTPASPYAVNGDGWPTWDVVGYQVNYVTPLYEVLEDDEVTAEHERFCVWRTRGVAQNEKIPGGGYKFNDGSGVILPEVGVKTGRVVELSCKWIDVPRVDYTKISAAANKVNSSAVIWNGSTYDAEAVLFTSWDVEPRRSPLGLKTFDITFNFSVRMDGRTWNKFWKNGASTYVEVVDAAGGGTKPFGAADLNTLWTFT